MAAALLVDFGGVLTTNVFRTFADFCAGEGLPEDRFATLLREEPRAAELLVACETGRMSEPDFEVAFAPLLGPAVESGDLLARLTATLAPDHAMLDAVAAVRRETGVRTVLASNSFGYGAYDGYDLESRFDALVLSGDIGVRKPSGSFFRKAIEVAGCEPGEAVFVDDLEQNVSGARRAGLQGIWHVDTADTIRALEQAFDVSLSAR